MENTQSSFESIPLQPQFDEGPGKYRIGLVLLSSDYATERDFMNMRDNDDIIFYSTRIPLAGEITVESLATSAAELTNATKLLQPGGRLDVLAYSCTSASVVLGHTRVEQAMQLARPGIPCVTPISAAIEALQTLKTLRVSVVTPYIDSINTKFNDKFLSEGLDIKKFASFGLIQDLDMANLTSEAIYQGALQADHEDSEAIFISCTAIRAVDVIERIEDTLGKPVVTSIQAMYWQCIRRAGYTGKLSGYGKLLAEH